MIVKGPVAALVGGIDSVAELVNARLLKLSGTARWLSIACRSICWHAMSH